jgi:hypothetical protein
MRSLSRGLMPAGVYFTSRYNFLSNHTVSKFTIIGTSFSHCDKQANETVEEPLV